MTGIGKVLIVDDQPINVALMSALVRNADELEPVGFTDPLEALRWCARERPILVLVDFAMPQMTGDEFIRQMRATEGGRLIPVVVVTAHTDRETLLRAFGAGASDFLRKPVDDIEVMARVRSLSQFGRASQQLLALATTDALTGLDNRRHFMAHLEEEVARVRRYGGELSVVMIDVDHFKCINDTAGHAAGDAVLCAIADRIRETIRDTDFVGRLGGESSPGLCLHPR